jgi:hypothetical protein
LIIDIFVKLKLKTIIIKTFKYVFQVIDLYIHPLELLLDHLHKFDLKESNRTFQLFLNIYVIYQSDVVHKEIKHIFIEKNNEILSNNISF